MPSACIRRHEHTLDRWFTQRFGYRLQVTADTARLFKSTVVARRRPLRTATDRSRPFSQREYTMLALTLAAVAAGPDVISLRDLIREIRSMATDADVVLTAGGCRPPCSDYRAAMDDPQRDSDRDARPRGPLHHRRFGGRGAACPSGPGSTAAPSGAGAVGDGGRSCSTAPTADGRRGVWMRSILLEEPVLYRTDLTDREWSELRRRLGEESAIFDEMFGMQVEARAEGVMVIDPDGRFNGQPLPARWHGRPCCAAADRPASQDGPDVIRDK